jgi:hypothetical protein
MVSTSDFSATRFTLRFVTQAAFPFQHMLKKQTPWPESASELYEQSDLRLSAKLVSTFADTECHVVSVTDPYGYILNF